jgi:hypothetical protein
MYLEAAKPATQIEICGGCALTNVKWEREATTRNQTLELLLIILLPRPYEILLLANAFALVIVVVSLPSFLPLFLVGML